VSITGAVLPLISVRLVIMTSEDFLSQWLAVLACLPVTVDSSLHVVHGCWQLTWAEIEDSLRYTGTVEIFTSFVTGLSLCLMPVCLMFSFAYLDHRLHCVSFLLSPARTKASMSAPSWEQGLLGRVLGQS